MPVTRSEGKGRKPSSSEATPETSATGTSTEATSESTQTGTTATESSEQTFTSTTTDPTTVTSAATDSAASAPSTSAANAPPASHPAGATAPSVAPSAATTLTAGAKSKKLMKPPAAVTSKENRRDTDASTAKRVVKNAGTSKPTGPQLLRPPSKKGGGGGSTHSKTKLQKITKAREDLLRLQVELAAARLAALETEDSDKEEEEGEEEDDVSLYSEVNTRVDNWLDNQVTCPVLAIANEPHRPPPEPTIVHEDPPKREEVHRTPAGGQGDLALLAEAITRAISTAQRPKFIELPFFSGSHQEWLPFRAAYYESEPTFSTVENINRLRRNLKGKAREAVEGLLITNAHPSEVMKTLESRFGRPESIAMIEMETLRSLPRLSESPRDICIFATKISNVVATLKTLGCFNYMYNPELAKTLVDKLTPTLRYRYYDFSSTQPKEDPCLIKLDRFFKREAELCAPYALPEQVAAPSTATHSAPPKKTQRVTNVTEKNNTPKCFVCDETSHTNATECDKFKKMEANSRWDAAKSKRLCFRCLRYRNKTHNCQTKPCGVNGCKYTHHKLLHYEKKTEKAEKTENDEATEVINSTWTRMKQSYLKILPVQVKGPKGAVNTFALMDDGSTVTLVDDDIAESIGATGPLDPLKIETINELKTAESASRRVTIGLKGVNNREEQIQARTVKNLQVSSQRVPQELVEGCPHLSDIKRHLTYSNAKPRILIGQDNWHLLLTKETRKGDKNHPVASLTPLGWVLHGSQTNSFGQKIDFVSHMKEAEDDLEDLVKRYFEMDALCINPKRPKTDPEEKALRILEQKTEKFEETRYQTGLLWKKEDIKFPDNYENSLKRLFNIEKKIDRDPALKKKYVKQMDALIGKGYAEPAPPQKTPDKTWYTR